MLELFSSRTGGDAHPGSTQEKRGPLARSAEPGPWVDDGRIGVDD